MAEATLNKEYAWRLLGVGLLMVALSAWSVYDGAVAWPRINQRLERARPALLATNLTAEAWLRADDAGTRPLDRVFAGQHGGTPRKLLRKMGDLRVPPHAVDVEAALLRQREAVQRLLAGPLYAADDLRAQFIQAVLTLALGLMAFGRVAAKRRRTYIADEAGLRGRGLGDMRYAWADLAQIDWSRWEDKGIFVITFKDGVKVRFDGWHFAGMGALAQVVQNRRPDLGP
jgi:hypothetical protein